MARDGIASGKLLSVTLALVPAAPAVACELTFEERVKAIERGP